MTNDVSIHIVNPDSVILKLIHDAQSLKGQYDSFSIFVDKHDDVTCCVDLDLDGKPEIWSTSMVKEHFYSSTGEIEVFKRPKKSKSAIRFNGYNGSAVVGWANAHVQDGHVLSSVMNSTKSNSIIIVSFKEKHTATIENPMWFVATDKGMLKIVTDTNFEAEYIREAK